MMAKAKKIITYPRAEGALSAAELDFGRAADRGRTAGRPIVQARSPVPEPPVIRRGAERQVSMARGWRAPATMPSFPNVNTIDKLREVWPRLSSDEKKTVRRLSRVLICQR